MMIRPKGDQLEIRFSMSDPESWNGFVQNLNSFLTCETRTYNDSHQVQLNDACSPDQYFIQEDSGEVRNNPKRSCQFNRTMLGDCSGMEDRFYGYSKAQPCILIKLNRVIGMLPGKDGQSPYVTCGAKKEDREKIGPLTYFPVNATFNLMYYPYYGKKAQLKETQLVIGPELLLLQKFAELDPDNQNLMSDRLGNRAGFWFCSKPVLPGGLVVVQRQQQDVHGESEETSQEQIEDQIEEQNQA
ncbi:hypothetical protein CCH79_00020677, partial [Gambusia affinis]